VNDLSTAAPSVPPLVDQMIDDRLEGVAPRRSSLPCRSKSSQPVEAVEHRDACLDQKPGLSPVGIWRGSWRSFWSSLGKSASQNQNVSSSIDAASEELLRGMWFRGS